MEQFQITLKNEKGKFYDRSSGFLFALQGLAIWLAATGENHWILTGKIKFISGIVIFILTFVSIYVIIRNKPGNHTKKIVILTSAIVAFYLVFAGYWWMALIVFFLFLSYWLSTRELIITVRPDKIIYPSFPLKKIKWTELNNMLIKDGLMTIDFKNNKIIQQPIDETKTLIKEKEFNDFCSQQLKAAALSI